MRAFKWTVSNAIKIARKGIGKLGCCCGGPESPCELITAESRCGTATLSGVSGFRPTDNQQEFNDPTAPWNQGNIRLWKKTIATGNLEVTYFDSSYPSPTCECYQKNTLDFGGFQFGLECEQSDFNCDDPGIPYPKIKQQDAPCSGSDYDVARVINVFSGYPFSFPDNPNNDNYLSGCRNYYIQAVSCSGFIFNLFFRGEHSGGTDFAQFTICNDDPCRPATEEEGFASFTEYSGNLTFQKSEPLTLDLELETAPECNRIECESPDPEPECWSGCDYADPLTPDGCVRIGKSAAAWSGNYVGVLEPNRCGTLTQTGQSSKLAIGLRDLIVGATYKVILKYNRYLILGGTLGCNGDFGTAELGEPEEIQEEIEFIAEHWAEAFAWKCGTGEICELDIWKTQKEAEASAWNAENPEETPRTVGCNETEIFIPNVLTSYTEYVGCELMIVEEE